MKEIGFKNFRKFENFPNMPFAPITIFVGGNNAGKSTVVKAILSVLSFLSADGDGKTSRYFVTDNPTDEMWKQKFYFNKNYFAHVGTFNRAVNYKHRDENITFTATFLHTEIEIEVKESTKNPSDVNIVYGDVQKIRVTCFGPNVDVVFDLTNGEVVATFHSERHPKHTLKAPVFSKVKDKEEMQKRFQDRVTKYEEYYAGMKGHDIVVKTSLKESNFFMDGSPIQAIMEYFSARLDKTLFPDDKGGFYPSFMDIKPIEIPEKELKHLKKYRSNVLNDFRGFGRSIRFNNEFENVEYIYAHAVTQAVVYSAKDKGDYVSATIHSFAAQNINNDSPEKSIEKDIHDDFIQKWMNVFRVGNDYEIQSVGGESHTVQIVENGNKVYLSDKGMGSIQIMILLFRLATLIREGKRGTTIIIEEPEQNLHPYLQSELANLFLELQQKYRFKLIVETHSEYLIRMCQVLVGDKFKNKSTEEFEEANPFKVYYFPDGEIPYYDMEFTKVGGFKRKFGLGFFNEAGRLDSLVTNNKYDSL